MRTRPTRPALRCAGTSAPAAPPVPALRYRLEVRYEVLPACEEPDLQDALDRVSADLHPEDVQIWSSPEGVHLLVQVQDDHVLEVYRRVAVVLEDAVGALRRHWPCPPPGGGPTIRLSEESQAFL